MQTGYTANLIELTPTRTYATRENAQKAVEKKFAGRQFRMNQLYFIATHTDGRFFPVFIGERAVQEMIHFSFNVVG